MARTTVTTIYRGYTLVTGGGVTDIMHVTEHVDAVSAADSHTSMVKAMAVVDGWQDAK